MIEVDYDDSRWRAPGIEALAEQAVAATLAHLGAGQCEVALLACDDARIAALNGAFRDKAQPTNVLSWPAHDLVPPALPRRDPDGSLALGDLALAWETCAREAADQGKSLENHATHLIVHGTLHLLGYDHERDEDATLMERLEVEILGKLGIADPYS